MRHLPLVLITIALVAGCTEPPEPSGPESGDVARSLSPQASLLPTGTPTSTPTATPTGTPTGSGPTYSTWVLGSRVLAERPDGYGVAQPTPRSLRVRRYRTVDVLAPPADDRFHATIEPISHALRGRMGATWTPSCPVALKGLRYLTVVFRGFDDGAHTGELVVAAQEADDVVSVFEALFEADFPIEEMRLPTTADLEAPPTGDGNNTAAEVCRPTTGSATTLSAHAFGLAIDLNPFMNPYLRDDLLLPELAGSYLDRAWRRPGMHFADSIAVREFARIGWSWGGDFQSLKDYHHFTATGR